MQTFMHVLETALPVFIAILIGMLCRSRKILTRDGINSAKRIATDITLPAVLFGAFATADYNADTIKIPVTVFILCCAALGLGFLFCKLLKVQGGLTPFLMSGFEAGMLGYGLFALLYKDISNSAFAIIDLGQVLFVFTLYRILLTGNGGIKDAIRNAIASPVLWAIAVGLIFGATGLFNALKPCGAAGVLQSISDFLAAPTSVLILLSIGYDLVPSEIRWRSTFGAVIVRVIVMAIIAGIALLINKFLLNGIMHTGALILMCILPPPYMLPVFSDVPEERSNISSALSILTLVTVAGFAIFSAIIG